MEKLKVAIIGTGHIAQTAHVPGFTSDESEVIAVCSRSKEKAISFAEKFSIIHPFDSIDEMLEKTQPDIVSVCTPNAFHYDAVMKSLDAGCHVLCEKPPATNYQHAKQMEEKAGEKNKILGYNFPYRQKKELSIVKKCLDENFFGSIYHINASFTRRRGIPGWGNFIDKDLQGGGALIDIGIHVLDLALHILNYPEPLHVSASVYDYIGKQPGIGLMGNWDPEKFTVEDSCFAHIRLKNNHSISLQAAFALNTEKKNSVNLEIFGSKAGASLFPLQLYTEQEGELVDINFPFQEEINHKELSVHKFVETCLGHSTNICSAREGSSLQNLIEMLYQSAK